MSSVTSKSILCFTTAKKCDAFEALILSVRRVAHPFSYFPLDAHEGMISLQHVNTEGLISFFCVPGALGFEPSGGPRFGFERGLSDAPPNPQARSVRSSNNSDNPSPRGKRRK